LNGCQERELSKPRLYTDDEVALILREAAQSADTPAGLRAGTSGLSLEQIKAAAAEAGLDPSDVERATLRLAQREPPSFLERVLGGPRRHRDAIHLPVAMNEKTSTRLLSAVRAAAEVPGEGRADASGFAWNASLGGLSVTAHEDAQGTRVQVIVERGPMFFQTMFWSQAVIVMLFWAAVDNGLAELLVAATLAICTVAAARAYWKSSTRRVRERIAALLEAVRESSSDPL
jgi:hypothetical protein